MDEANKKNTSIFYKTANIASIAGFYMGGLMQLNGMANNYQNPELAEAGLCVALLSGGYWLGKKFTENQFKKSSNLEKRVE